MHENADQPDPDPDLEAKPPSAIQWRRTRIVCISDTHKKTPHLPRGDVLVHAGDMSNQGSVSELRKTAEWLEKADFEAKIVVAGTWLEGCGC